eukprot:g12524.t1
MEKKTVVAIDLGTSRSAYAFSILGRAQEDIIIRVPEGSRPSVSAMKTETAVLLKSTYPHDVLAFGRAAIERFIEEAEEEEDSDGDRSSDGGWLDERGEDMGTRSASPPSGILFRWFKVELCQRRGYRSVDDPVATAQGGQKLPLMVVMTAVLRHFKEDAIAHLSFVSEMPQTVDDVTWVVTVPAIYDDFAKHFMRVAAHKAGITPAVDSSSLQLCLEPEAACLAVTSKDAPHLARKGNKIMILDCGGGTVDITTHEVLSMNPLRLKELLPPTGGAWGSTCLDEEFRNWCESFFGEEQYTQVRQTSSFYSLLAQWEEGKTGFSGNGGRVRLNMLEVSRHLDININKMQELRLAYNNTREPEFQVKGSKYLVVLPCALVESFFAPTLKNIVSCLASLKQHASLAGLKYIFLVGGFASSPLTKAAVRAEHSGEGRRVLEALRPEVAIVRGAVLFANNTKTFTTRKARLTYGVKGVINYDGTDPEHVRRKQLVLSGRIETFDCHLKIGDDVPLGGACPRQCYGPVSTRQSSVEIEILASRKRDVRFPDADTTCTLGKVSVPLDMGVSLVHRAVEVQFEFGRTEFSVTCFRQTTGEKVGTTVLSFVQELEEAG